MNNCHSLQGQLPIAAVPSPAIKASTRTREFRASNKLHNERRPPTGLRLPFVTARGRFDRNEELGGAFAGLPALDSYRHGEGAIPTCSTIPIARFVERGLPWPSQQGRECIRIGPRRSVTG
jgi:hypothetical protein